MEERADRMPCFMKRNDRAKIGIVSAFYGLILSCCAPTGLCGDTDSDCLALEVEGAVEGTPVRIELLDAAGQRLARYRTKTSNPERTIQVKPDGFALRDVACVRVRSGEGRERRIANISLSASTSSHRRDLAVALQVQADTNPDAAFKLVSIPLNMPEAGRSAKISTLPDKTQSVLILGTKLATSPSDETGRLTFYQLAKDGNSFDKLSDPAPIALNMPPSPIVTARKRSGGSLLAVGRSSQDPVPASGAHVLWPLLFSGSEGQYTPEMTALPSPGANILAIALATASLNDDGIPDFIINFTDLLNEKNGAWTLTSNVDRKSYREKSVYDSVGSDFNAGTVFYEKNKPDSSRFVISNSNSVTLLDFDASSNSEIGRVSLEKTTSFDPIGVVVGNYNGDENTDLAALINQKENMPAQEIHIWKSDIFNNLDSTKMDIIPTIGLRPRIAISEDLNGDQFDDIATADYGIGGSGTGHSSIVYGGRIPLRATEAAIPSTPLPSSLLDIAVGDLNSDCKQDLVIISYSDSQVYVLLNQTNFVVMPM